MEQQVKPLPVVPASHMSFCSSSSYSLLMVPVIRPFTPMGDLGGSAGPLLPFGE